MFNACGSWREDLEFVHQNFGDMRKQKDFLRREAQNQ